MVELIAYTYWRLKRYLNMDKLFTVLEVFSFESKIAVYNYIESLQ